MKKKKILEDYNGEGERRKNSFSIKLMISLQCQSECHDGLKTCVYIYVCAHRYIHTYM